VIASGLNQATATPRLETALKQGPEGYRAEGCNINPLVKDEGVKAI
jgi:hypothetical protein